MIRRQFKWQNPLCDHCSSDYEKLDKMRQTINERKLRKIIQSSFIVDSVCSDILSSFLSTFRFYEPSIQESDIEDQYFDFGDHSFEYRISNIQYSIYTEIYNGTQFLAIPFSWRGFLDIRNEEDDDELIILHENLSIGFLILVNSVISTSEQQGIEFFVQQKYQAQRCFFDHYENSIL